MINKIATRKELRLNDKVKILGTKGGIAKSYDEWVNKNPDDCCVKFLKKKGYLYVTKLSNDNVFVSCKSNNDLKNNLDWTLIPSDISVLNEHETTPFVQPKKILSVIPLTPLKFDTEEVNSSTVITIADNQITAPFNILDYELEDLLAQIKNVVESQYERYSASTFREFMISKNAMWCQTIQQAIDFIQKLENMKIFTIDENIKDKFYNNICFSLDLAENEIVFNTKDYYRKENKKIVKF